MMMRMQLVVVVVLVIIITILTSGPQYWSALLTVQYPTNNLGGVIIISGASSGIGLDAAVYLGLKGFHVFAGVRKESDFLIVNQSFKNEMSSTTTLGKVIPIIMDVSRDDQVNSAMDQAFAYATQNHLPIAGIVTNAGTTGDLQAVEFLNLETVKETMNVNLFGAIRMTTKALPKLRNSKGRIVTVSSANGKVAVPLLSVYSASKSALEGFHDSLRREVGKEISVSIIDAACVKSKMAHTFRREMKEASSLSLDPMYGSAYEFTEIADVLCSNLAKPTRESSTADIYHALTSEYPHTRYYPGDAGGMPARLYLAMAWLLPDRVIDLVFSDMMGITKRIHAETLKKNGFTKF